MSNKKISELRPVNIEDGFEAMAVAYRNEIRAVNLSEFDCTNLEEANKRVKDSIDKYGHVLIIPYKPI